MDSQGLPPEKWIYHSRVIWEIYNFFYRSQDMINIIESSEFKTNFDVPVRWRLTLRLREKYANKYVTEICLMRVKSCAPPSSPCVIAHIKLTDNSGDEEEIIGDFEYTHDAGQNFLFRSTDDNITSYFDKNSTVSYKIECDMFFYNSYSTYWSVKNKDLDSLSMDLRIFYLCGNLTDLVLKVGNERFPVNRTIVQLRSPCVARLLAQNPDVTEIDLSDKCSLDELRAMIYYWYCGYFYKWPRGQPSKVSTFLQKMEQDELMQYFANEDISLSTILVTWVIVDRNFFHQLETLNSEEVSEYGSDRQSWKLHFYPKGEAGDAHHISLCVEAGGEMPSTHPVSLRIFFKGGDGKEYGLQNSSSWTHSSGKCFFHNFMSHSDFNNLRESLLSDDALVIGCRIECGPAYSSNPANAQATKHPYEVLADKLKDLWDTRETGDVTLKTDDGKKLRAHSAIVVARSKYMEDLMHPTAVSCKSRELKLHNIKKEDLEPILKYMYHAEINLNLELAQKLYPAAHEYRIQVLEDLCSEYLQSHLNVECAVNVLSMSVKFPGWPLKTTTSEFVVKNFVQISETEEWRSFRNANPELSEEINQRFLVQSNSE